MATPEKPDRAKRDLVICIGVVIGILVLAEYLDLSEIWHSWTEAHGDWRLHELLVPLGLSSVCFAWYSYRRWRDSRREAERRIQINRELAKEISARQETERSLRERERRYRELFDESPVAIWEEDWSPIKRMLDDLARDGVEDWRGYFDSHRDQLRKAYDAADVTEVSRATVDIYRARSKEELLRWSVSVTVINEELDAFREIVLSFLAGQTTVEIESKDTTFYDSEIMLRRRVVIPPRYRDDWSRVIYAIEDITERWRIEEAVRRSEARLTAIMMNAPTEIYLKDLEGRYVLINSQFEKLWDVTNDTVIGKLPADIYPQKEFAAAARSHDLAVLGSGEVIEQEDDILREDGLHTVHTIKFPIRDFGGEIAGLGAIATDVTQRKKLDRIKNEFISTVSHELRTPMTAVVGALGLIRGGAAGRLPEKAQSMIDIAHRNCERLVRLLNDILDIERIESGKFKLEVALLDPGPLVRDTVETVAAYAKANGVEVRFEEDAGKVAVKAEADRLAQVLINLLSNAIKFSPRGGVVDVRISRNNGSVRTSVTDQGPGIPEAFRDRVFERFAQGDATDSSSTSGSGLGLAICKLFIEAHGGHIAFDTEIGKGTTFYFDLPECAEGQETAAPPPTADVRT